MLKSLFIDLFFEPLNTIIFSFIDCSIKRGSSIAIASIIRGMDNILIQRYEQVEATDESGV